jgi:hypothetical protein
VFIHLYSSFFASFTRQATTVFSDIYRSGRNEKFFFFYPEIVDVERKKIEKERRKKKTQREKSCGLIINLFAFMHNDKYSEALDEHYLIVRKDKEKPKEIQNSILITC